VNRTLDPRAAAIRWYTQQAARLRTEARQALRDGWAETFYEWTGLASIAERAALAEVVDKQPEDRP
jgi:hypothetical protein